MPALPLLPGTAGRAGLPILLSENMFAEASRTEPGGVVLVARPELQNYYGAAYEDGIQTNAVFQDDEIVGGSILLLIGNSLYVDGVDEGTVPGGDTVYIMEASFAGNSVGVVMTAKQAAKFWDGTTFRSISFPDGANVTKVAETQGRFVFLRAGSHRYYWTEPLSNMIDGSGDIVIDALDYASAENKTDVLRDVIVFRDQLILGGAKTIEMHGVTGNDDLPWAPTLGSTIPQGVYSTGSMTLFNGTFAWADQSGIVRVYDGSGGTRISTPAIEAITNGLPCLGLDSFFFEGHEFLHLKTSAWAVDFIYDAETGEWSEWSSGSSTFFGGRSMVLDGVYLVFGSSQDGTLLVLSRDSAWYGPMENGIQPVTRTGIPFNGGSEKIDNLFLRCVTGSYSVMVEMRLSRDRGETWTGWRIARTNAFGDTLTGGRSVAEYRSLGQFDFPGVLFEFRLTNTDAFTPTYVSSIGYNEPLGYRRR